MLVGLVGLVDVGGLNVGLLGVALVVSMVRLGGVLVRWIVGFMRCVMVVL